MYSLSGSGSLTIEADTTWVQRLLYYSISHNVYLADKALGAGGCKNCHSSFGCNKLNKKALRTGYIIGMDFQVQITIISGLDKIHFCMVSG